VKGFGKMIGSMVFVENSLIMVLISRVNIKMGNRRDRVCNGDKMNRMRGNGLMD